MRTPHTTGAPLISLLLALIIFGGCPGIHAAGLSSLGDVEKPKPAFTQDGDRITAKFIPRAKSTSVTVDFQVVDGGVLTGVKGIDFAKVDRPEVDVKNFRSAVFEMDIRNVPPGGQARLTIRSDFFSVSTAFFAFNPQRPQPWFRDVQTDNRPLVQRVRELVIPVQDGGDLDADGAADGRVLLIGGPRDSFWGYALGTLFIRFFGIFFVLSILMAGMIVSGRVFTIMDRLKGIRPAAPALKRPLPVAEAVPDQTAPVPEAVVAAIAVALSLHNAADLIGPSPADAPDPDTAWRLAGRQRMMQERLEVSHATRRQP